MIFLSIRLPTADKKRHQVKTTLSGFPEGIFFNLKMAV
jgi:hypothetical protein